MGWGMGVPSPSSYLSPLQLRLAIHVLSYQKLRIWMQKKFGRSPCWSPNSTHLYLEIHLLLCNYTICMYKSKITFVDMSVGGLWKLRIVDDKPCLPVLQESNFLINGRSYILWFNYGVSARISTKTGANQTILQIIEIGYFFRNIFFTSNRDASTFD